MKRTDRCTAEPWAVGRLHYGSKSGLPHRRRHRERRFHVPRQALGLDLKEWSLHCPVPAVKTDPPATEPTAADQANEAIAKEAERLPRMIRQVLWTCVIVLVLILCRDGIVRIFREAPFAWPSLDRVADSPSHPRR